MKSILSLSFLLLSSAIFSQSYNVLLIPDSLKKNADLVVREDVLEMEIKSPGKATIKKRHVYTILNEKAAEYAGYASGYDKFTSINYIDATLYDAMGKEIKHVKKKDMQDRSGTGEESLMSDARYKQYDFYYKTYPYTVAFEEEDDLDGLLFFREWMPIFAPNTSVIFSKHIITAPKDYLVRYTPRNCSIQPIVKDDGNKKIYTWQANNLMPITQESNAPEFDELVPQVLFAPSDFEAEGYRGNMSSWSNFGKFFFQLIQGRDGLPDNVKAEVHKLTDGLTDERKKVYVLYDFLQKNTRYISIQMGIGGWQPFDATYVATKRYGDCKALSNYMIALLKEAGIKGKYVKIMAGEDAEPLLEEFPSMQSNHAIACVPMKKDTIWLECTSQITSAGFMGEFTGDRKAILIDEDGGHVVKTPTYTAADNMKVQSIKATVDIEGNLDAQVNTRYTGIEQELPNGLMHGASKEQRDKYLNTVLSLPTYQVDKSNYEEERGTIPTMKEYLHITSGGYASVTGKRLFIAPNLFDKESTKYSADSARKYEIVSKRAFIHIDSISIQIPDGYSPESLPQNVKIESKFGKYSCATKVEGNKIFYVRLYEKNKSRFPASDYQELVKFQDQIYKADRARLVLVKKE